MGLVCLDLGLLPCLNGPDSPTMGVLMLKEIDRGVVKVL